MKNNPPSNNLVNSTSPYLLQHANNPVNWYPWGEEAFERAMKEDKPIILSIGYSSCHWCHVMEKESFENEEVAAIMNEHFISVKVDREERPDIDQIYMDAVQAMGVSGGWPLNVFLTPDLKPFYGGTYFPADNWSQILKRIAAVYEEKRDEVETSANQLVEALYTSEVHKYNLTSSNSPFNLEVLDKAYEKMTSRFDMMDGGIDKAPKFPMPGIWLFLIRYSTITEDKGALEHLKFTLNRMASGGIFDQAGGGFARYSTDKDWFAPHFEKMLYDNGQLLSLYAEAYTLTKEPFYKDVIERTVTWLEKEMMNKNGGFYSALDADSEGEEGRFYVYTIEEIEKALPEELVTLAKEYYNITGSGNWEHGKNILHATMTPYQFAEEKGQPESEVKKSLTTINNKLYEYRSSRTRPGLDDKILTSWNALTISGLADCYKATGDKKFLKMAVNSTEFIRNNLKEGKKLCRSYNKGKAHIDGYLEDYAHYIQALIKMYEITFEESYLEEAFKLSKYVIKQFFDPNEGLFYFTANDAEVLIARKKEIFDNVIPASNSVMGINLYLLSYYYDESSFRNIAENMMRRLSDQLPNEPVYLSTWGILYFLMSKPITEFVIVGKEYKQINKSLNNHFLPGKIVVGTKKKSGFLPLLHNRIAKDDETTIYVCYNKSCKLPVFSVADALKQLH